MGTEISGGYVSADGHIVEPADLFTTRMDRRFRDRAPHIESRPDGDYYVIEGLEPVGLGFAGEGTIISDKAEGKTIQDISGQRIADTRPGAWDPKARLEDQDLDHVRAEIIYPGIVGLWGYATPDPEYHRECVRVYNDWLAEFCAHAPNRLLGAALVPMHGPVDWVIEEAQRAARLGLRALMLPNEVSGGFAQLPDADRLWAALQEVNLPISLHVGTGTIESAPGKYARFGMGAGLVEQKICTGARGLADLIWAGIPQAFPGLRFVIAEGGIGWIASVLRWCDHWWEDHRAWMEPRLEEPPSSYFHRHFWATFEDDRPGLLTRELLNIDHLMWGSDYPHTEGVFPHSQEKISEDFVGIPEDETHKIVGENAAALYGIS